MSTDIYRILNKKKQIANLNKSKNKTKGNRKKKFKPLEKNKNKKKSLREKKGT